MASSISESGEDDEFYIPYAHQAVMNIISKITAQDPRFLVVPQEEDANKKVDACQKLLDWQIRRIKYSKLTEAFVWSMAVYGTAITKVSWNMDDSKAKLPIIANVQPEFFYPAPDSSATYLPWCYQSFVRTIEELRRNSSYDASQLHALRLKGGSGEDPDDVESIKRATLSLGKSKQTVERPKFKVVERWGLLPRKYLSDGGDGDPDEELPSKLVVAEGTIVLQAVKNPFVSGVADYENPFYTGPFAIERLYNKDNEFWGDTFMSHIAPLMSVATTHRRQLIENNSMMNNRMYVAGMGAGFNKKTVRSTQGGVINLNDINQFRELQTQPIPASSYQMGEIIKGDVQQTTGANDWQIGMSGNKPNLNNTATGILAVNEQVNSIFKKIAQHIEWQHEHIGEMVLMLDQKYLPSVSIPKDAEASQQALGVGHLYDFMDIDKDAISGLVNVHVEGGSTQAADPQTDIARIQAAMNILLNPAVSLNVSIQWSDIILRAMKDLGFKNPEQYIVPTQPPVDQATLQGNLSQLPPEQLSALANKLGLRPQDIAPGNGVPNVDTRQNPRSIQNANRNFKQSQSVPPQAGQPG